MEEKKRLWYVEGHPEFLGIKGYTFAKDMRTAAKNVGLRNGLWGDDLDYFAGNADVVSHKETKSYSSAQPEEPCTVEELYKSLEVLDKLGASPGTVEIILHEIEKRAQRREIKERDAGQLFFNFPTKK